MEHVMICNYQNIYDYCLNKFSYQYATTPASTSGDITTSVIRTDKDTGEIITISPDSDLYILPCDNNDIVEVMSVWECYEIYVSNNKIVSQPSLVTLNTIQKEDVVENYDSNLQDGVTIKIDSYNTIILDGKIENQIHLGNVICLANILYNEDANSVMPYILDINNIAYYLNYSTLKNILTKYFQKVSDQKNAKDDLLNQLETIKTSDDILNKYYCNEKVSKNIIKENIVIDYSTYQEVSVLPPDICDPPCSPSNCEQCINGVCIELGCQCYNCGQNSDCAYYGVITYKSYGDYPNSGGVIIKGHWWPYNTQGSIDANLYGESVGRCPASNDPGYLSALQRGCAIWVSGDISYGTCCYGQGPNPGEACCWPPPSVLPATCNGGCGNNCSEYIESP